MFLHMNMAINYILKFICINYFFSTMRSIKHYLISVARLVRLTHVPTHRRNDMGDLLVVYNFLAIEADHTYHTHATV